MPYSSIIRIIELDSRLIHETGRFIKKTMPEDNLFGEMNFYLWLIKNQERKSVKKIAHLLGFEEFINCWVAMDSHDVIAGTIGLFSRSKDTDEAFWISYFCVASDRGGTGIGKALLERAIELARARGKNTCA